MGNGEKGGQRLCRNFHFANFHRQAKREYQTEKERIMIRILHIVGSMHPGGMENFVMNLYEHIDRSAFQFDVIVHMRREDDYVDRIRQMGGRVYELPRLTSNPIANLRGIRKIVKENGYPLVIRHTPNALIAPQLLAAKRGGALTACHSHNETDPKQFLHRAGRFLMKHMKMERFACSERAGKWMFGNRRFRIVHNAVDMERFCFSGRKRDLIRAEFSLEGRHVYGHIANFTASKNHAFLIKIYAEIAKTDSKAAFFCIGDGELRKRIEQEAKELGIADKVLFTGMRQEADAFMSAMDVLVFPSVFEGLPLTLIEAQAAGLPILLSKNVTRDVEVTKGLIKWKSIDEKPEAWAAEAFALVRDGEEGLPESRACQREAIAAAGYDIRELVKWYEAYFRRIGGQQKERK